MFGQSIIKLEWLTEEEIYQCSFYLMDVLLLIHQITITYHYMLDTTDGHNKSNGKTIMSHCKHNEQAIMS